MCIICNVDSQDGVHAGLAFLGEYGEAQRHMKKAAAALLEVKQHVTPEQARQYDRIHKRMKAIMRDWNNIEHRREQHGTSTPTKEPYL